MRGKNFHIAEKSTFDFNCREVYNDTFFIVYK